MTDHTTDADHVRDGRRVPDYELAETLTLSDPAQYRALFEDTRTLIVGLLLERAATTSELAEIIGKPKGTIGHHLRVLADAGLVRVVRTKRVRALEAKYYGRTARTFLYHLVGEAAGLPQRIMAEAAAEIATVSAEGAEGSPRGASLAMANIRHARIPAERAEAWAARLNDLVIEFTRESRGGDVTFGLVVGIYATTRPTLRDADDEADEPDAVELTR